MEDDSSPDITANDLGTNKTTSTMISTIPEKQTPTPGKTHQSCPCGWVKVTSAAGLRIHQGRKRCLKRVEHRPRIDHYFLRSTSSQATEVQRQVQNHSPQNISPPVPEEEEDSSTADHHEPSQQQHATETKIQGQKPPINWPKSCEKKLWDSQRRPHFAVRATQRNGSEETGETGRAHLQLRS